MNLQIINSVFDRALQSGRDVLLETEGLDVLAAMGLPAPAHVFVAGRAGLDAEALAGLPGSKAVVKVISPQILHKSDVGGVAVVDKTVDAVTGAIARMDAALGSRGVVGYTINEFIPYAPALGRELLVGLRWTDDIGPVVTVGAGGIHTEFLAKAFRPGLDVALLSPALADGPSVDAALRGVAAVHLATQPMRGQASLVPLGSIAELAAAFLALGRAAGSRIAEFEVNPFVITQDGRIIALDVLLKLRRDQASADAPHPRPIAKLDRLLRPRSVAVMGVSERLNPGHIIVKNLLREGFAREHILIVKAGAAEIEGCRCVAAVADIPDRVDLFVLCVDAAQASSALVDIIEHRKAESVILIPGGLEEKAGSEAIVARMHAALADSRRSEWGGPVINGGNCLGIRSRPGRYDTTFIPEYKLPAPDGVPSKLAIISQSGAFAVSRSSKLSTVNPRYSISLGNQMDVTIGDYLSYLKDDAEIDVFAVYVEGFRPLDGLRFLEAARDITSQGRTVMLYRAGRTPAGAQASASHTASIAGDYAVMRGLCAGAGVVVVDALEDFEGLTLLFASLSGTAVPGWRLAAVSNAGAECVAIADNLGRFTLPPFTGESARALGEIFVRSRIDKVADVHNPIDLTPMTGDEAYAGVVGALLADEQYDALVVGIVPLTASLNTLPPGPGHRDDLSRDDGIVARLAALRRAGRKPWVAVVDAGALYDPMAQALTAAGIPTFRSADRALRLFNAYCAERRRAAGLP